jgi:hypothetical protein
MAKEKELKLPAGKWLSFFEKAGILTDQLAECKSEHRKAIRLGQFLSPMVGREVRMQVGERTGKAVLQVEQDRGNTKSYFFKVTWDNAPSDEKPKGKSGKQDAKKPKKASSQPPEPSPGEKKVKTQAKTRDKVQDQKQPDTATAGGKKHKARSETKTKNGGNNEDWG